MTHGWIKLHRQITENWIWKEKPFSKGQAWMDLIMLANHQDGVFFNRGIKVEVKRGCVGHSQDTLAKRWGWSVGKVRRFLFTLKTDGMIDRQINNVSACILIVKYDQFQNVEPQVDRQTAPQTEGRQHPRRYPNKNDKKNNNEKNEKKEDWMESLKADPIYSHVDFPFEIGKAKRWCEKNRRKFTERFFLNWVNKVDKPVNGTGEIPYSQMSWDEKMAFEKKRIEENERKGSDDHLAIDQGSISPFSDK